MSKLRDQLSSIYRASSNTPERKASDSTLRRELERLHRTAAPVKYFPKTQVEKAAQRFENYVEGSWINTAFGDVFRAESQYPLREAYGRMNLAEIYSFAALDYSRIFQLERMIQSPAELLFVDTETTGLSGGTGTLAFMVGLGWLEADFFHVHQYFITQLSHEEGMLDLLRDKFQAHRYLVSFNGKSFDIPLLNTRFILNRQTPVLQDFDHIDLLHISRSLWRYSLENCKLKTLEADLFGVSRTDDIPGELVSEAYLEYLRTQCLDQIQRIFEHNRFDIISLLANLLLVMQTLDKRQPEADPRTDLAKGRHFLRKNEPERSIAHYRNVLKTAVNPLQRQQARLELANLYKKAKQYAAALPLWQASLESEWSFFLEPYVELAKYYEHIAREPEEALRLSQAAYSLLPPRRAREQADLEKRIRRLERRLVNSKAPERNC
jgi:uncharacterized protein YprB with RNaseH-like and TPR domain